MWMPRGVVAFLAAACVVWGTPKLADAGLEPPVTDVPGDHGTPPRSLTQERDPMPPVTPRDGGPEPFLLMPDHGETLGVSLDQCIERALLLGEEVRTAEAVRSTAHARYLQARSTALPQVTLGATYTRQLESIFQGTGDSGFQFEPDTLAEVEDRVRYLEEELPNSGFYAISELFSNSSFASENTWNAALGLRQRLLQGGSIVASIRAAGHALEASRQALADKRLEISLQVRTAYLDALLADRAAQIATLTLEVGRHPAAARSSAAGGGPGFRVRSPRRGGGAGEPGPLGAGRTFTARRGRARPAAAGQPARGCAAAADHTSP